MKHRTLTIRDLEERSIDAILDSIQDYFSSGLALLRTARDNAIYIISEYEEGYIDLTEEQLKFLNKIIEEVNKYDAE
ncbi:MAG: hypothetical protein ABIL45_04315 [candidate division WOR-3 bacterium]